MDHGEFITLVAGKRRSLLMAGNNNEVYDKKPQRYAEDVISSCKSEALRPVYSDTTQLNSTDLLRADWLYAATGSVALPIAGDS